MRKILLAVLLCGCATDSGECAIPLVEWEGPCYYEYLSDTCRVCEASPFSTLVGDLCMTEQYYINPTYYTCMNREDAYTECSTIDTNF